MLCVITGYEIIGCVALADIASGCDVFIVIPIDGAASVICGVPKICPACWVLANANCCPCVVFAAMANGVLLVIICVCGCAILAMLTIGVACTCTGAIETAFKTCKQNGTFSV